MRGKGFCFFIGIIYEKLSSVLNVTRISKSDDTNMRFEVKGDYSKKRRKSSWIAKFDEESGEEHIYRVPQVDWFWS